MNYSFRQKLNSVYWRKEAGKVINITNSEMYEKILQLKVDRCTKATTKTSRDEWLFGHVYRTEVRGAYRYLYVREEEGYKIYATNIMDDKKNTGDIKHPGREAIKSFHDLFKLEDSATFKKAFGYTDDTYKKCVPKQFVYVRESYRDKIVNHVSSIDGSAQYLSHLKGKLPDSHTAKRIEGTVKPTEEYPFAFYLKSGHLAEYNNFDTHDWLDNHFVWNLFTTKFTPVPEEEDVTILMKASPYTLDKQLDYFYDRRKVDSNAKLVVNAAIGFMHTRSYKNYRLAHLAAISIARSNNHTLQMIEQIGHAYIIQVCVDGIMYLGKKKYGSSEKELGTYYQEFTDCKVLMRGANAYIAMDGDKVVKVKHGAYNVNNDGSPIKEETVKCLEDAYKWKTDKPDLSKDDELYEKVT